MIPRVVLVLSLGICFTSITFSQNLFENNFDDFYSELEEDFVFLGETHTHPVNAPALYSVFEYLNKNHGFDFLIIESSLIYASLLNHYVQTGDTVFFKSLESILMKDWNKGEGLPRKKSNGLYLDFFKKYRALYVKTKTKFQIVSIDLESFNLSKYLKVFVNFYSSDTEFGELIAPFEKISNSSSSPFVKKTIYKQYLKAIDNVKFDEYIKKNRYVKPLRSLLIAQLYSNHAIKRRSELNLYKNFKEIKRQLDIKKGLIRYGSLHAKKDGCTTTFLKNKMHLI